MKVKAFLLAALLCCGLTASAQQKGDFRFGPTVGMNVTNISDSEMDCRVGFHVGLRAQYFMKDNLYLGFGALFTQKGAKYEDDYAGYKAEIKMNPGYIQIPLAIGYRFDFDNDMGLFLETGPQLAIGVCGKSKFEIAGEDEDEDFFGDPDDGYAKRFEFGWGVRAGFDIKQFQIGLGYEYGCTKIWDEGKNHNWNFNVGLTYNF